MSKSYNYAEDLSWVQVELSTYCNALCLGCVRTTEDGTATKSNIPNAHLKKELILDLVKSKRGKRLKKIEFCGTIDEPFAYPEFYELIEGIIAIRKDLRIYIHTNGSLRNPDYFRKVAKLMGDNNEFSLIRFSIDGLEDTNHIYRQRTSWNLIMDNLKAVCETNVRVIWQFIVFPWNEHQTKSAERLAKEMGCTEFWLKPDRSDTTLKYRKKKCSSNRSERALSEIEFGSASGEILKQTEISCSFNKMNGVFVSWEGKVWPCCYIANSKYGNAKKHEKFKGALLSRYEAGFNDLNIFSFDDVLEHEYFQNDLKESWENRRFQDLNKRCFEKCNIHKKRTSDEKKDDRLHYEHVLL